MADEKLMTQEEIERLLTQGGGGTATPSSPSTSPVTKPMPSPAASGTSGVSAPAAQADVDKLLAEARLAVSQATAATAPNATTAPLFPSEGTVQPSDVEYLLDQAEQALASVAAGGENLPPGAAPFRLEEFSSASQPAEAATIDLIRDVELDLRIELGRTMMYLEDVLKLRKGSVVPLDKLAGDPVDVYVNGRLIARGEVLVLNDNFCVRVAELVAGAKNV
jgi:flagellar motor switch protein FliN/FliY